MTEFIEVNTQDLSGAALDWVVSKAEKVEGLMNHKGRPAFEKEFDPDCCADDSCLRAFKCWKYYTPSTDWSQCGPLIEKNKIGFGPVRDGWVAHPLRKNEPTDWLHADEPLVAICRAIVADKLGMVVSTPKELMT